MAETRILAIDPGNTQSAFVLIDQDCSIVEFDKQPNQQLAEWLSYTGADLAVIEMVASYGMAVGAEVFDTCVWIGRFQQELWRAGIDVQLIKRHPVKMHHCHSAKANDANITRALVDRFAYGQPNHGKGTKKEPGWFHGFHRDIWQAYALAVYAADLESSLDLADVRTCVDVSMAGRRQS